MRAGCKDRTKLGTRRILRGILACAGALTVAGLGAAGPAAAGVPVAPSCPSPNGDAYSTAVLADSPAAYYRMDESSGAPLCDSSAQANNGTYSASGITYGVTGALSSSSDTAVSADGTPSTVGQSSANVAGISGNSAFTLEAWFKNAENPGAGPYTNHVLVSLGLGGNSCCTNGSLAELSLYPNHASQLQRGPASCFGIDQQGSDYCWDATAAQHPVNLWDGSWHYLAVTYNPTGSPQFTGYVDGENLGGPVADQFGNAAVNLNAAPVILGPSSGGNNPYFHPLNGGLDEAAVYPAALSSSRIAAHYQAAGPLALSVTGAGTGTGTVTSSPSGINCGGGKTQCANPFTRGTQVTLTAAPGSSSAFAGWSGGGCSGTATTCQVFMNQAQSVTATFNTVPQEQLSVSTGGSGSGMVTGGGISCPGTCSASENQGSQVTLSATAASGSSFTGWSGGGCSGFTPSCVVTMSQAQSVTATFTTNEPCPAANGDAYSSAVLADSPVAYYRLDEPSGPELCDSSAQADDGVFTTSGITYGVGGALSASSDPAVSAAGTATEVAQSNSPPAAITGNHAYTLEAWFKNLEPSSPYTNAWLVALGATGSTGQAAVLSLNPNHNSQLGWGPTSAFTIDQFGADWAWSPASAGVNLWDGNWHYLAVTYTPSASVTASAYTGYVDGQNLGSPQPRPFGNSLPNLAASPVILGSGCTGNGCYWKPLDGGLDEVAVYPAALPAARIAVHYAAVSQQQLTVSVSGSGTVTSSPAGINCGAQNTNCAAGFASNAQVTLTATPASGASFTGWSGGGCSGTTTTCKVTMSQSRSVSAGFVGTQTLNVAVAGAGSGTVTGSGISCPGTCSSAYPQGTQVTLTESPASGSTFAGWSSAGCSGTVTTCQVTMSQAQSVTASFAVVPPPGAPGAAIDPGALNFSAPGGPQTVKVTDNGTAPLAISGASLTGSDASAFSLSADACSGQTLQPGAACTIAVSFAPAKPGSLSASLVLADNASGSPQGVPLSGTSAAGFTADPGKLGFPSSLPGNRTAPETVTVKDTGNGPLFVFGATLSGASFQLLTDGCSGRSLAPGGSCQVRVVFDPDVIGVRSGSLSFGDDAPGSPQTVGLSGSGLGAPGEPQGTVTGGGLNLDAYCQHLRYAYSHVPGLGIHLQNGVTGHGQAFKWFCVSLGGRSGAPIDIQDACYFEYGPGSLARLASPDNAYTWSCVQAAPPQTAVNAVCAAAAKTPNPSPTQLLEQGGVSESITLPDPGTIVAEEGLTGPGGGPPAGGSSGAPQLADGGLGGSGGLPDFAESGSLATGGAVAGDRPSADVARPASVAHTAAAGEAGPGNTGECLANFGGSGGAGTPLAPDRASAAKAKAKTPPACTVTPGKQVKAYVIAQVTAQVLKGRHKLHIPLTTAGRKLVQTLKRHHIKPCFVLLLKFTPNK